MQQPSDPSVLISLQSLDAKDSGRLCCAWRNQAGTGQTRPTSASARSILARLAPLSSMIPLERSSMQRTWVRLKSAMRNMNFRTPSRREMTAESEMAMVRPRYLGWLMRAKMMPIMTASMTRPTIV